VITVPSQASEQTSLGFADLADEEIQIGASFFSIRLIGFVRRIQFRNFSSFCKECGVLFLSRRFSSTQCNDRTQVGLI
jgi:hypothetical protein